MSIDQVGQIGTSTSAATITVNQIDGIAVPKNTSLTGYTGDIYATISATTGPRLEGLIAGLQCDGTFHGSVSATSWIGDFVAQGDIGASSSLASVTFGNYIANTRADAIYATINGGSGFIKRIETTVGNITGSIAAARLDTFGSGTPGIFITGDLDANVTFSGNAYYPINIGGKLKSGRTLKVGEGLGVNADITIGSSTGLEGQITIGYTNPGVQFWAGDVTIGSTTLSNKPYYPELSTNLGGGSVGLVKFNFHGAECSPINASGLNSPPTQVLIEHYGPVAIPTGNPLKVEAAEDSWSPSGCNCPSWSNVTSNFDYAIASGTGRKLQITPKAGYAFSPGTLYRISPAGASSTDRLRCAGVTGSPDAVYLHESAYDWFDNYYHFVVYTSGFDLNESGEVDGDDVDLWFMAPVDFDEDSDADLDDLELLKTEAGF